MGLGRGKPLERRTPLRARKRLAPGRPIQRHTPLATVNRKRERQRRTERFGAWAPKIRAMPCWWCGTTAYRREAAHALRQSQGGTKRELLPMCADDPRDGHVGCHTLYDEYRMNVDRAKAIEDARALYDAHHQEVPDA